MVASCGPHRLTPAEQRKQKQEEAAKQKQEARTEAARKRVKAAQEKAKLAAMPSTPPGIEQMDSTHFYVHYGFEGNTRDLCRSGSDESPAGINSIDAAPNGSKDMIITCNNAEHEYRHVAHKQAPTSTTPTK
jgi:hypothetical protein